MKCITCSQEIPDTSTTCPYCNNKVEPIVSASEALGVQNSVLPQTPDNYKLPKDQVAQPAVQPSAPVAPAQNIPAPPPAPNIPAPPPAPETNPVAQVENVGTVQQTAAPAPQPQEQTYFDPTKINLDGVDLNANANAQTLDYTQVNASDRLGSTIDPKKPNEGVAKAKKKVIVLGVTLVLVIAIAVAGGFFYFSQFQSADKRIDKVVDGIFNPLTSIKNEKFEEGSGSYKLNYSSSKNADEFKLNVEGKYGYNLPSKKIDLISNFKSINRNQELLDNELNVELYLENSRSYLLLQNFKNDYVYTDIDNSYNVIKDIESRFDKPEELLLFKLSNTLFDSGLDALSKDYHTYITNISQNEINYQNITKGLKEATKEALKGANPTQSIQGGANVIKINLKNPDTMKNLYKSYVNALKNNQSAWSEISKIYGDGNELYRKLIEKIDKAEYQGINSDIIIATDMFKNKLKYIVIPTVKDGKICYTTITPSGSGYKIVSKLDGREIVKLTYSKSSSKTSTTENKVYKLNGTIYSDGVADNINLELELVKDINVQKINVITRNSIDYQYLTNNDYSELAGKLEQFGNLGVLFKSHYKGAEILLDENGNPIERLIVPQTEQQENNDAEPSGEE